jgi:hypothetical protein
MGTCCLISKKSGLNYNTIYCHWDGYIKGGVGETLFKHFYDASKVEGLINLGDISSLGKEIYPDSDKAHDFYNHQDDVTVAYIRDRGEDANTNAAQSFSFEELVNQSFEFIYVFMDDNCWYVYDRKSKHLLKVSDCLKNSCSI